MIRAANISYQIGSRFLLKDIDISFTSNKINLIVGPNGAGKSTLIKILSRQLQPTGGTIRFGTKEARDFTTRQMAAVRAVLSQHVEIPFPLRAWEVVMMGRYPHFVGLPGPQDEQAVQEAMRLFEVEDMADRNFLTLSGGEMQRVNFARVLAQIWHPVPGQPRYLLLDEPLTFLDVHFQFQFMHLLEDLLKQPDLTVVGVVHDLNLAARFSDHLVLLHQGSVLAQGSKEEVLTRENIREAFHIEPIVHQGVDTGSFYLEFR